MVAFVLHWTVVSNSSVRAYADFRSSSLATFCISSVVETRSNICLILLYKSKWVALLDALIAWPLRLIVSDERYCITDTGSNHRYQPLVVLFGRLCVK